MAKKDKTVMLTETTENIIESGNTVIPKITDLEWTDYVLGLLSEDEKIAGNPTTDGLRRIFEIAMNCRVLVSSSNVAQAPDPNNEKRATVVHTVVYHLNGTPTDASHLNTITVDGAADVYWGNCDKVYRNHPVAVAETRAEGRALRRALKLRKVVAAEELAKDIEDNPDNNSVSKISHQQINFIDIMAQRLNISVVKLFKNNQLSADNIYSVSHDDAVNIIRLLSKYQQNTSEISEDIMGYSNDWK